jgi:hypothetical protein
MMELPLRSIDLSDVFFFCFSTSQIYQRNKHEKKTGNAKRKCNSPSTAKKAEQEAKTSAHLLSACIQDAIPSEVKGRDGAVGVEHANYCRNT